jgi:tetratricopeptide (TPR) repeat protein
MASLGVASPKIYEHPFHLTGDAELAKSPLAIEAVAAYNRSDKGAMALACSKLTDAFPQSVEARAIALFAVDNISEIDPQSTKNKKALHDAIAAVDALDPANPYTTMVRAYALYAGAGKNREAIELLTSVIARSDLSPALRAWALRRRALPESSLGNRAAAISDAQEAIRLDPTTAGCYQVLSRALRLAGRPDEALERAQQALALDPTYWYNWEYVGIALGDLGQQKESLPYRIRACELSGAQAACTMTALSLLKLSRTADARAAAEYAAKLTPSIYGAYNLACYHAVAGERSDAFTFLHRALDLGYSDALIETDSDFTSLRGDPEFEKIVVEVKARIAKQRER